MAVILVTGGSSGIGLAIVRRLADAGDRVFAASRNPERESVEGVTPLTLDLTDAQAVQPLIDQVIERAGRLDGLVNNAGAGVLAPVEDTTDADASMIFETNLLGPLRLARAAIPIMRKQGRGRIVNVTSMNDTFPAPFGAYYSASKAALASASLVLDAEVRQFGIAVSVVAPGLFLTPMAESLTSQTVPEGSVYRQAFNAMIAQQPARVEGAGDPDLVAQAVADCLSADDPPARVAVGADAEFMEKLAHDAGTESLAQMLRDFVANLVASES